MKKLLNDILETYIKIVMGLENEGYGVAPAMLLSPKMHPPM
jgi:hypothetical protein